MGIIRKDGSFTPTSEGEKDPRNRGKVTVTSQLTGKEAPYSSKDFRAKRAGKKTYNKYEIVREIANQPELQEPSSNLLQDVETPELETGSGFRPYEEVASEEKAYWANKRIEAPSETTRTLHRQFKAETGDELTPGKEIDILQRTKQEKDGKTQFLQRKEIGKVFKAERALKAKETAVLSQFEAKQDKIIEDTKSEYDDLYRQATSGLISAEEYGRRTEQARIKAEAELKRTQTEAESDYKARSDKYLAGKSFEYESPASAWWRREVESKLSPTVKKIVPSYEEQKDNFTWMDVLNVPYAARKAATKGAELAGINLDKEVKLRTQGLGFTTSTGKQTNLYKSIIKPSYEFIEGANKGIIEGVREEPVKTGVIFAATTLFPSAAYGAGALGAKIASTGATGTKIVTGARYFGTSLKLALGGLYGYNVYRGSTTGTASERGQFVGRTLSTEIVPAVLGFSVGSSALNAARSAYYKPKQVGVAKGRQVVVGKEADKLKVIEALKKDARGAKSLTGVSDSNVRVVYKTGKDYVAVKLTGTENVSLKKLGVLSSKGSYNVNYRFRGRPGVKSPYKFPRTTLRTSETRRLLSSGVSSRKGYIVTTSKTLGKKEFAVTSSRYTGEVGIYGDAKQIIGKTTLKQGQTQVSAYRYAPKLEPKALAKYQYDTYGKVQATGSVFVDKVRYDIGIIPKSKTITRILKPKSVLSSLRIAGKKGSFSSLSRWDYGSTLITKPSLKYDVGSSLATKTPIAQLYSSTKIPIGALSRSISSALVPIATKPSNILGVLGSSKLLSSSKSTPLFAPEIKAISEPAPISQPYPDAIGESIANFGSDVDVITRTSVVNDYTEIIDINNFTNIIQAPIQPNTLPFFYVPRFSGQKPSKRVRMGVELRTKKTQYEPDLSAKFFYQVKKIPKVDERLFTGLEARYIQPEQAKLYEAYKGKDKLLFSNKKELAKLGF